MGRVEISAELTVLGALILLLWIFLSPFVSYWSGKAALEDDIMTKCYSVNEFTIKADYNLEYTFKCEFVKR